MKRIFTIFFLTVSNWVTPSGISQVPVRAEVFGYRTMAGGAKHKFHHIYDYSEFQAQPPLDQTVFEVMKFISLLLVL